MSMPTVEGLSHAILDQLQDGVYLVDRSRKILYWNAGAERISGYPADEVIGRRCFDNLLIHVDSAGESLCQGGCPLEHTVIDGKRHETEVFLQHKEGHRVSVLVRTAPIRGTEGEILGGVEIFSENRVRMTLREEIDELKHRALHDALTGLANRHYLELALQTRREELDRYGWPYAMILLDIDHFKGCNDRYGHEVGDQVLTVVAKTLASNVRSSDLVGRWADEEFLILLRAIRGKSLEQRANELRSLVASSSLTVDGEDVRVTVSMGATVARPGEGVETPMKRVGRLLSQSKAEGRDRATIG